MKTFAQFIEMWDWEPEQTPEKQYSSNKSYILQNLPTGVFTTEQKAKNSIRIEFTRYLINQHSHLRLYIPFGKQHFYKNGKDAKEIAMNIVKKENNNYSVVYVFNMNVFSGRSIFSHENPNLYFTHGY